MATDRKAGRNESMLKSQYYGLSHGNHLGRSRSKEAKEDLTKDISQKILFPLDNSRKDTKAKADEKNASTRNKNSYFFDTP